MICNAFRSFAAAALIAVPGASLAATAVSGLDLLESDDEDAKPWAISGSLSLDSGLGTYVSNGYSDNPYTGSGLSLAPSYTFKELPFSPTLSLLQIFSWEYSDTDSPAGRRFDYLDTQVVFGAAELWKEPVTGIKLGGSFGFTLPISYASRLANKVTATSLGFTASRALHGFALLGGLSVTRHWNTRSNVVYDSEAVGESTDYPFAHCRNGESVCIGGGYTAAYSGMLRLGAGYEITEKLAASIEYRFIPTWRNASPRDEFTTDKVEVTNRASDQSLASIGVGYQIDDHFSLGASTTTQGTVRNADADGFRFPFFDTQSAQSNRTSFSLSATATY